MKNDQLTYISAKTDNLYGAVGTLQRKKFNENAWKFYLKQTHKNEKT